MGRTSYETTQHCPKRSFSDTRESCRERKLGCRNWLDLPEDISASIFSRLKATEILDNCQLVCKRWLKICKVNPLVWQTIDMHHLPSDQNIYGNMEHMCRDLIDRSCGSLVDINVVRFGTDRLLKYITDSSSCGIRRLRLECCPKITNEGLCGVASKFARLKELDISVYFLSCKTLEVIGRSCPLLVSLNLNHRFRGASYSMYGDTIARTMRGLHNLSLSGFVLTNDELRKILESCLGLETLDLGECFAPNLEEDLRRRCVEQIRKKLRLPYNFAYYDFRTRTKNFHHMHRVTTVERKQTMRTMRLERYLRRANVPRGW